MLYFALKDCSLLVSCVFQVPLYFFSSPFLKPLIFFVRIVLVSHFYPEYVGFVVKITPYPTYDIYLPFQSFGEKRRISLF